jgi:hypothetical protein
MTSLLKRLSKSNDTIFSGRILSFLAALLPLFDPSGTLCEQNFVIFLHNNIILTDKIKKYSLTLSLSFFSSMICSLSLGLNKRGLINVSNITRIDEMTAQKEMEDIETEGPIDLVFWRNFWTVQQYVQNPWTVFDHPTHWTQMTGIHSFHLFEIRLYPEKKGQFFKEFFV